MTIGNVGRDGARFVVPVEVRDADSALKKVEYSLDAQKWQSAFPRDGILDSRRERFEIRLDANTAGRMLVVRATDAPEQRQRRSGSAAGGGPALAEVPARATTSRRSRGD